MMYFTLLVVLSLFTSQSHSNNTMDSIPCPTESSEEAPKAALVVTVHQCLYLKSCAEVAHHPLQHTSTSSSTEFVALPTRANGNLGAVVQSPHTTFRSLHRSLLRSSSSAPFSVGFACSLVQRSQKASYGLAGRRKLHTHYFSGYTHSSVRRRRKLGRLMRRKTFRSLRWSIS